MVHVLSSKLSFCVKFFLGIKILRIIRLLRFLGNRCLSNYTIWMEPSGYLFCYILQKFFLCFWVMASFKNLLLNQIFEKFSLKLHWFSGHYSSQHLWLQLGLCLSHLSPGHVCLSHTGCSLMAVILHVVAYCVHGLNLFSWFAIVYVVVTFFKLKNYTFGKWIQFHSPFSDTHEARYLF